MAKELREEDRALRSYVCSAFIYMRDPASAPALEEMLKDRNAEVRQEARIALQHIRRANQSQSPHAPAQK